LRPDQEWWACRALRIPRLRQSRGRDPHHAAHGRNGVLHELDTFSDWSITYTAPSQGTSFSFKFGPATFVYPEGTAVGAPAIITLRGVNTHYPGFPAEAGRLVILGEVIDVTSEGVPIADFVTLISQTGNILPPAESQANLCEALSA
jgi:hypothetical protein